MTTAASALTSWQDYWDQDSLWSMSDIWDLNARLLTQNILPRIGLTKSDSVLNIGSGTGALELILSRRVSTILSLDTSPRFTQIASERTRHLTNVTCRTLGESPESLEDIRESFSLFLCISVIQYFSSADEIKDLLSVCRKLSKPGAKILLGDLCIKKSIFTTLQDILRSLLSSIQNGYFLSFSKIALRLLRHGYFYRKFRAHHGELCTTREELEDIASGLGFHPEWIETAGSIYLGRPSLLLHPSEHRQENAL